LDGGDGEAGRLQARDHRLAVEAHDRAVADQRGPRAERQLAQPPADALERAGLDDDAIRPAPEIDRDAHPGFPALPPEGRRPPRQATSFGGGEIGACAEAAAWPQDLAREAIPV